MSLSAAEDEIHFLRDQLTQALDILRTIVDYGECTGDCTGNDKASKLRKEAGIPDCLYCRSKKLLKACKEKTP